MNGEKSKGQKAVYMYGLCILGIIFFWMGSFLHDDMWLAAFGLLLVLIGGLGLDYIYTFEEKKR